MLSIDRRAFLTAASAGLILPARPALAGIWPETGFTHGVASGNPGQASVTLWTRYVSADGKDNQLLCEMAEDAGFTKPLGKSFVVAATDDWGVAQLTVRNMPPGRWFFYRFTAPDKTVSPVGRTRTLPVGPVASCRVAVFSCSNKPFGWFNAYAHCAARQDIDLVIHVGDYIYEYPAGEYPAREQSLAGRDIAPATELLHLDDYRQRYASYRSDPALQELHRLFPMISIWDDHEFANDAWLRGAQNHQPEDGNWTARKVAAMRAHREWLMNAQPLNARADFGDLVSIITLDTRLQRDQQLDLAPAVMGGTNALADLRDKQWNAIGRSIMGYAQEEWLRDTLKASVQAGQKWQLLAQQVVMGNMVVPPAARDWLGGSPSPRMKAFVEGGILAGQAGLPGNMDSWGGYPQNRARVLRWAQEAGADLVVTSGDSHNAWAYNLSEGGQPAGVEFAGQSVTSPGYESALRANPDDVRAGLVAANPEMVWCDTSRRGYLTIDFTPDRTRADWVFMASIRDRSLATTPGRAAVAKRGERRMTLVEA